MKIDKIANPMQTAVTPAQAARICGLSHATIARCFDRGLLKGFRIPGSNWRRIPIESLRAFIQEHNLPVPDTTLVGLSATEPST